MSDGVHLPSWGITTIVALCSTGFGYVVKTATTDTTLAVQVAAIEKRQDKMDDQVSRMVDRMGDLTIKLAENTVQLRNFNRNLEAAGDPNAR